MSFNRAAASCCAHACMFVSGAIPKVATHNAKEEMYHHAKVPSQPSLVLWPSKSFAFWLCGTGISAMVRRCCCCCCCACCRPLVTASRLRSRSADDSARLPLPNIVSSPRALLGFNLCHFLNYAVPDAQQPDGCLLPICQPTAALIVLRSAMICRKLR